MRREVGGHDRHERWGVPIDGVAKAAPAEAHRGRHDREDRRQRDDEADHHERPKARVGKRCPVAVDPLRHDP